MSDVHIYAAGSQPATCWRDHMTGRTVTWSPRKQAMCHKCRKRRWAARLIVQVYYDGLYVFCAPGHGCKVSRPRRKRKEKAA